MALSEEYYKLYDKILAGVEDWDYLDLERLLELSNQEIEKEIKKKAVEAFRLFVEDYCSESGRKDIAAESEHYLKIFNELINK